jgi:phosphatidylinositol alpha-mannosyltransferase
MDENEILRFGRSVPFTVNGSTGQVIMIKNAAHVIEALKREKFDIIHLQEPFVPFLSHAVINNSTSLNVATFHANFDANPWYRLGSSFLRPIWKKLNGRIAVSPSARKSIEKYFTGHDIEVISNGVDTDRFSPKNAPLEKFSDGKINILFTGRIEKRKGLIYLIRAYMELKKKYPAIRLIVVGKGPLLTELRKYIIKHRIRGIHFEGFVSTEILPRYFATADIFCSPALFGESFGIVLLEAMAAGKPVVAFNISGYRDVVDNGKNGLLAETKNHDDLAKKLESLVKSGALRKKLGNNGLAKAKKFTWKIIAQKNILYYKKLWNAKGGEK